MREIKFRVWNGMAMEYRVMAGFLGAFYVEGIDPLDSASMSQFNTLYSKETPVMEYTGLKDENGKEIYEGDILLYEENGDKSFYTVEFIRGAFISVSTEDNEYNEFVDQFGAETRKIIGNIYENSDLVQPPIKDVQTTT